MRGLHFMNKTQVKHLKARMYCIHRITSDRLDRWQDFKTICKFDLILGKEVSVFAAWQNSHPLQKLIFLPSGNFNFGAIGHQGIKTIFPQEFLDMV